MAQRGRPKKNKSIEDNVKDEVVLNEPNQEIKAEDKKELKAGDTCPNCGVGKLQNQQHVLRCAGQNGCAAWYPRPDVKTEEQKLKEENEKLKKEISENQIKAENEKLRKEIEELRKAKQNQSKQKDDEILEGR